MSPWLESTLKIVAIIGPFVVETTPKVIDLVSQLWKKKACDEGIGPQPKEDTNED